MHSKILKGSHGNENEKSRGKQKEIDEALGGSTSRKNEEKKKEIYKKPGDRQHLVLLGKGHALGSVEAVVDFHGHGIGGLLGARELKN